MKAAEEEEGAEEETEEVANSCWAWQWQPAK